MPQLLLLEATWAPIPGAPGYEVSTDGRVRRGAVGVAPWPNAKGYHLVNLEIAGVPRLRYVHRLVLAAFRGAPRPGLQGNHEDGRTGHNALENLTWMTPAANVAHARRMRAAAAGQQSLLDLLALLAL